MGGRGAAAGGGSRTTPRDWSSLFASILAGRVSVLRVWTLGPGGLAAGAIAVPVRVSRERRTLRCVRVSDLSLLVSLE